MKILAAKQLDAFLRRRRVALDRAEGVARPIIEDVRKRGDRAVREYALKFDRWDGPLKLTLSQARTAPGLEQALRMAARNIERFARLQKPRPWMKTVAPGVRAGQAVIPLASVGCYAPGGRFPLPSTVLMTAIPARVAGVAHVAVACPRAPEVVLAAARLAGADALYPVGGVQAIAAMAYGTRTIRRVDRIVGPGNLYVTAAQRVVSVD